MCNCIAIYVGLLLSEVDNIIRVFVFVLLFVFVLVCMCQCTMCRMGSFKCVRLKSDADSSKFPEFFSHSKKFSVSDFTRTHFLIFEKNSFSNSKL